MKIDELRKKSAEELEKMEHKTKKELARLYLKLEGGRLSNANLIKETRKDIARIMTVKNQYQHEAGRPAARLAKPALTRRGRPAIEADPILTIASLL